MSQQQQSAKPVIRQPDVRTQLKMIYDKPALHLDESIAQICPQVSVLNNLIQYEQRIDHLIKVKRGDLQESFIQPPQYIKKTLRVIVYSEMHNDEWRLFIKGALMSEDKKPLSHYFRQIEIHLDKTYYPQSVINWTKMPQAQETSSLEVRRKGPLCDITIMMHPYTYPQKYKLSKSLQSILGLKEGTRSQILYCFWEYIKLNNLLDKDNKEYIVADEQLKQLMGQERILIANLNMHLKFLIENLDPIIIRHHGGHNNVQGIDIVVDYELHYQPELMPFLAQKVVTDDNQDKKSQRSEHPFIQLNQKLKGFDKQMSRYVEQTRNHKQKRDCYYHYQRNPSLFLENLFIQQNSLLEMMQNEDEIRNEDPKTLKFLVKNQEIVERQIRRYVEQQYQQQQQQ